LFTFICFIIFVLIIHFRVAASIDTTAGTTAPDWILEFFVTALFCIGGMGKKGVTDTRER
jgi:hypothetical protein